MADLNVTDIAGVNGTDPAELVGQYPPKAIVRLDGSGTISIDQSQNISSIVDVGTGRYTANLTNSLNANDGVHQRASNNYHTYDAVAGSASTIEIATANSSHALADSGRVFSAVYGDLA